MQCVNILVSIDVEKKTKSYIYKHIFFQSFTAIPSELSNKKYKYNDTYIR